MMGGAIPTNVPGKARFLCALRGQKRGHEQAEFLNVTEF